MPSTTRYAPALPREPRTYAHRPPAPHLRPTLGRTRGSQPDGTLQAEPPGALRASRARTEAKVSPERVHEEEREAHRLLQHSQRLLLSEVS